MRIARLAVVNQLPGDNCTVDHPVLNNLVLDSDIGMLLMTNRLSDKRFEPSHQEIREFLWSIGVDADFPQSLEVGECSFYDILSRYVRGEPVSVLTERSESPLLEVMGYHTWQDLQIVPLQDLTLMYYTIHGEREYFFDEQGRIVYPYYIALYMITGPAHLLPLMYKQPGVVQAHKTNLAEFFERMRQQALDVSHEIWDVDVRPNDNLARIPNYLDYRAADEYQEMRKELENFRERLEESSRRHKKTSRASYSLPRLA